MIVPDEKIEVDISQQAKKRKFNSFREPKSDSKLSIIPEPKIVSEFKSNKNSTTEILAPKTKQQKREAPQKPKAEFKIAKAKTEKNADKSTLMTLQSVDDDKNEQGIYFFGFPSNFLMTNCFQ